MKIDCIAIDDEPIALRQISAYIEKTPFLNLLGSFENALEAVAFLGENKVSLMFVDIQMPDMSGMDLVKSLTISPLVIFTTASRDHAVEGFQVNAIDYILKPLDYTTFLKSAQKARDHFTLTRGSTEHINANADYLFIKSEYKIIRIEMDKILYVEGMREYVRIHLENSAPIMTLLSMKSIDQRLPDSFMRVHKSYIVNLKKITTIERSRIVFDKIYIPVSEQYKEAFQKYIDINFLI